MKTFNVLFVDDQRAQMDRTEQLTETIDGLVLHYAPSRDAALRLVIDNYYHLAIVDVSLEGEGGGVDEYGGLEVLRRLQEVRPSCERLLLTTVNEDRHEVLEVFFPEKGRREPIVHGFVDKMVTRLRAHEIVQDRAERWLAHRVGLSGDDKVLDHITDRGFAGAELSPHHGSVKPTADEVDAVLSKLFGQGRDRPTSGMDTISDVELQLISEGWSKSVVLWCEPSIGDRPGPRCLVKIGPRADSLEEVRRYESFVRFGLGLNHRVELLTSEVGDTIGAACYTHVEARGEHQRDLQHLFNREADAALVAVERLFDPEAQAWTADRSTEEDLAGFFVREYGKPLRRLRRSLREFVDRAPELSLDGNGMSAHWADRDLVIPTGDDLGLAAFSGSYEACVVHGDLHGGNVLVTGNGQPVLIDYRNMGRGPRSLDFVSLEVSVRMSAGALHEVETIGPDLVDIERERWRADWGGGRSDPDPDAPYWQWTASLIRRLMRENHPDATLTEFAATALLRSMRVVSAFAPQDRHRLRLLPFLSVLTEVMRAGDDG